MAVPATRNLTLYEGDTWRMTVRIRALDEEGEPGDYLDLTDAEPKAQIRNDEGSVIADITCTLGDQEDPDELGLVLLELSPEETTGLTKGKWDFQITYDNGDVRTYLKGSVAITAEITK